MTQPASLGNLSQMTGLSPAELARRAEALVDTKTGKINALSALDAALVANSATAGKSATDAFAAMAATTANPHAIDDPAQIYTHGAPTGGYASEPPATPTIGGPVAQLEKAARSGATRMSGFCGAATPPPAAPPPAAPLVSSPEGGSQAAPASGCEPAAPPPSQSAPLTNDQAAAPVQAQPAAPSTPSRPARGPLSRSQQALQGRMHGFGAPAPGSAGGRPMPVSKDAASVQGSLDESSRNMQFEMIKLQITRMNEAQTAISNTYATMNEQAMTAIRNAKA